MLVSRPSLRVSSRLERLCTTGRFLANCTRLHQLSSFNPFLQFHFLITECENHKNRETSIFCFYDFFSSSLRSSMSMRKQQEEAKKDYEKSIKTEFLHTKCRRVFLFLFLPSAMCKSAARDSAF